MVQDMDADLLLNLTSIGEDGDALPEHMLNRETAFPDAGILETRVALLVSVERAPQPADHAPRTPLEPFSD